MVASGIIKITQAASQDRLDIQSFKSNKNIQFDISQKDFYTEMQMRGFQYADNFKNVLKATSDGKDALIKWNDNWDAFIDNALQLYVFGNDSRKVEMPFLIRKIVIDHELHEEAIKNPQGLLCCYINLIYNEIT